MRRLRFWAGGLWRCRDGGVQSGVELHTLALPWLGPPLRLLLSPFCTAPVKVSKVLSQGLWMGTANLSLTEWNLGYPGHFRLALEVDKLGSEPFTSGVCSDSRWLVSEMNCMGAQLMKVGVGLEQTPCIWHQEEKSQCLIRKMLNMLISWKKNKGKYINQGQILINYDQWKWSNMSTSIINVNKFITLIMKWQIVQKQKSICMLLILIDLKCAWGLRMKRTCSGKG